MQSTQGQRKASIIFGKRKDVGTSSDSRSSNPGPNSHLARSPSSLPQSALVRLDPRWPCFACRASRAKCKCSLLSGHTRTWGATYCVTCSPFAAHPATPLQKRSSLTLPRDHSQHIHSPRYTGEGGFPCSRCVHLSFCCLPNNWKREDPVLDMYVLSLNSPKVRKTGGTSDGGGGHTSSTQGKLQSFSDSAAQKPLLPPHPSCIIEG